MTADRFDQNSFHLSRNAAIAALEAGLIARLQPAAACHLVEAGQAEAALALWRDYGVQEIAQGQAAAALTLFQSVQRLTLPPVAHEQATLICAQLQYLLGQPSQAATTLQSVLVRTPILAIEAAELTGVIANDQSAFDNAATAFAQALRVAEALVEPRLAHVYKGRAWLYLRQREIAQFEYELALTQFEIENMRGNLALDRAEYGQAADHYHLALQTAEAVGAPEAVGKCRNNLGGVALFQGRFTDAIHHLPQIIAAYERIGKVAAQAGCRITLAVAHNQAGEPTAAHIVLKAAEELLARRGEILPWQGALIAQARAEAYLALGEWAQVASRHRRRRD